MHNLWLPVWYKQQNRLCKKSGEIEKDFVKMTTTGQEATTGSELDNLTASQLFEIGWRLQQELDKSADESSTKYALDRKKAIEHLQRAQSLLDELHIFSKNEDIDEVSTNEIK